MRASTFSRLGAIVFATIALGVGDVGLGIGPVGHAAALAAMPSNQPRRIACGPVAGAEPLLVRGTIALFGEIHGTKESPAFVARVLCLVAASHIPVTLGVEWPSELSGSLDKYVHSDGGAAARAPLFSAPFWSDPVQDGRRSAAMIELVEAARRLAHDGADVRALAFSETAGRSVVRDSLMATTLARMLRGDSTRVTIVITGNIHSRLGVGTPFDSAYVPMGLVVGRLLPGRRLWGLDASAQAGDAWMCGVGASCGPTKLSGAGPRAVEPGRIVLSDTIDDSGHNGHFGIGAMTASPPFR